MNLEESLLPHTRRRVQAAWREDALCAQMVREGLADPDWWFPEQHKPSELRDIARSICLRCPVKEPCLDWAVKLPELHGIWGGLSVKQRRSISGIRVSECPVCGKEFTYQVSEANRSPRFYCSPACKRSGRSDIVARAHVRRGGTR